MKRGLFATNVIFICSLFVKSYPEFLHSIVNSGLFHFTNQRTSCYYIEFTEDSSSRHDTQERTSHTPFVEESNVIISIIVVIVKNSWSSKDQGCLQSKGIIFVKTFLKAKIWFLDCFGLSFWFYSHLCCRWAKLVKSTFLSNFTVLGPIPWPTSINKLCILGLSREVVIMSIH